MTTSQRELLILLAKIVLVDVNASLASKCKIRELLAEINAGSQDIR